jgi:1,2-diacylglycerol 3-alpha-glucosyltransferase
MAERPLKIALFSDSALPVLNGVSISIDGLIRALRRQGHSVHLFTADYPGHQETDPNTHRFRAVITPWVPGYPMAYPPFIDKLREFRKQQFDVIHTHTPFTIGFVGMRWAQSAQIPIVSTYHTLYDRYAHYLPKFLPKRYVRFKIAKHTNYYYNQISEIIVPSNAAKKWLQRHDVRSNIHVIPTGGLDRQMLSRSDCRAMLGIDPSDRMLLYVGRLAKEKNLDMLFEAARHTFEHDAQARLWLVGDGPYREALLEKSRSLGIGDRVHFAGFVPRAQVDPFYAAADLFLFSSMTETQGLVLMEAMLYGVPAIAVTGGGASEGIVEGENGFIVRNDPLQLANQALAVLSDDLLHAKLSAGAERSMRDRTVDAMASQVVGVYRSAIEGLAPEPELEPVRLL